MDGVGVGRRRVAIFVHGLGMNGGKHGQALKAQANTSGWELHFSSANTGSSGIGTFLTTLGGIVAGGTRLAEEIVQILGPQASNADVALIGASLGGMYCRYAAGLLWGTEDSRCLAKPVALITLASPHLGVYGLFQDSAIKLAIGRLLFATPADLTNWNDDGILQQLASGSSLRALALFKYRAAYAPIFDDGIVAYPSAALRSSSAEPFSIEQGTLLSRDVDGSCAAANSWCRPEEPSFVQDEDQIANSVRDAALALLTSGQWQIVDVNMNHRQLASLYPTEPSLVVAADVWSRLSAL